MSTRTKRAAPITLDGLRDIYVAYVNRGFPGQCPACNRRAALYEDGGWICEHGHVQLANGGGSLGVVGWSLSAALVADVWREAEAEAEAERERRAFGNY